MEERYRTPESELIEEPSTAIEVSKMARFFSLCMTIGAIIALLVIASLSRQIPRQPAMAIVIIPFALLFVFYIYRGVRLWKFGFSEYKWAFWLFALQIPILSFPGFSYHLFTGFLFALQFGDVINNIVLNAGGAFNFYISTDITKTYFGINIFAIFASIYFYKKIPKNSSR